MLSFFRSISIVLILLGPLARGQEFNRPVGSFDLVAGSGDVSSIVANGALATGHTPEGFPYRADTSAGGGTAVVLEAFTTYPSSVSEANGFVTYGYKRVARDGTVRVFPLIAHDSDLSGSRFVGYDQKSVPSWCAFSALTGLPGDPVELFPAGTIGIAQACSSGGEAVVGFVQSGASWQGFIAVPDAANPSVPGTPTLPLRSTYFSSNFTAVSGDPGAYVVVGSGKVTVTSPETPLLLRGAEVKTLLPEGRVSGRALCTSKVGELAGGSASTAAEPVSTTSDGFVWDSLTDTVSTAEAYLRGHGVANIPAGFRINSVQAIGVTQQTVTLAGSGFDGTTSRGWIATVSNSDGYYSDEVIGNYWRAAEAFALAYPPSGKQSVADAAEGYYYLGYYSYFNDRVQGQSDAAAKSDLYSFFPSYGYLYYWARAQPAVADGIYGRIPQLTSLLFAEMNGEAMQSFVRIYERLLVPGEDRYPAFIALFDTATPSGRGELTTFFDNSLTTLQDPASSIPAAISYLPNGGYPPDDGFTMPHGPRTIAAGTVFSRYGYPGGRYLAVGNVPFWARSLPPSSESSPYNTYIALKPFNADAGRTAPWFAVSGGGVQLFLGAATVQALLDAGILAPYTP